jgi:hypothetical protein
MKFVKFLVPIAPIAIFNLWVLWLGQQGLLPNPIATHWGISGKADGFAGLVEHLAWSNFAFVVAFGILAIVLWYPKIYRSLRKLLTIIVGYFATFITALMTYIIWIQIGVSDASSVELDSWFVPLLILPVLLLVPMLLTPATVVLGEWLEVRIWGLHFLKLEFSEIRGVTSEFIKPSQFGGWGLRISGGKVAFISSKGPALRIDTKNGEIILIRSNQVENLIVAITPKLED